MGNNMKENQRKVELLASSVVCFVFGQITFKGHITPAFVTVIKSPGFKGMSRQIGRFGDFSKDHTSQTIFAPLWNLSRLKLRFSSYA